MKNASPNQFLLLRIGIIRERIRDIVIRDSSVFSRQRIQKNYEQSSVQKTNSIGKDLKRKIEQVNEDECRYIANQRSPVLVLIQKEPVPSGLTSKRTGLKKSDPAELTAKGRFEILEFNFLFFSRSRKGSKENSCTEKNLWTT